MVFHSVAETTVGTAVTVNSILAGPTRSEGVGGFIKQMAEAGKTTVDAVEKQFFQTARPSSLLQRFATPGSGKATAPRRCDSQSAF